MCPNKPNIYLSFLPHVSIAIGLIAGLTVPAYAEETEAQINTTHDETSDSISDADEYTFDPAFFRGSKLNQKALHRLSKGGDITPGLYKTDIFINNKFIDNSSVQFIETADQKVKPCFTASRLQEMGVITLPVSEDACGTLDELVGSGSSHFDISNLHLNLTIPQSLIKQTPRGYVPPSQLESGATIGFINYYTNLYYNNYESLGKTYHQNSAYVSLNGGFNLGAWQFRQQSSLNYTNSETNWDNIRSYVKRPIPKIQSELSVGQLVSSGRFFSGLNFTGINLSTDDRMLPDSMRGYAPVVQGIATTNAKVSIFQNGNEIYQTTVAPGPFKISDLYPTSYNGDLNVVVNEADGTVSEFRVPFSAVPESIRQGAFKYNIDIGRTRNLGQDTEFSNITTQYGLSNSITLNNGIRVAEDYLSAMLGTAYTNRIGAFGTEMTFSRATVPNEGTIEGWMFGANYSKTIQTTDTTIALAGYRFSTEGYRDLVDVISLRQATKDNVTFQSPTYKEQSRATIMLNQSLGDLGMLYISGSASKYRDDKPNDYQFQLGYGKTFNNGISLNVSASRQNSSASYYNNQAPNFVQNQFSKDSNTTYALSLSIPIDKVKYAKTVSLNYNGSSDNNNYQTMVNGDIPAVKDLSYTAGFSYDDQSEIAVWNAGLNKRFNAANTSFNASKGDNYWQTSANIQGALAIHSGGVTFGPYLGDTFALVEAKNAEGANILNAQGTKVNKSGYALIPALTPYRYNTIALNPEGMSSRTELIAGDVKVAPYSGAAVKVNFKTRQGYAMLINSKFEDGESIPLGSDVQSNDGENIGTVGQNGQVYLRASEPKGKVLVVWGDEPTDHCAINYEIPKDQIDTPLIRLNEFCRIEN